MRLLLILLFTASWLSPGVTRFDWTQPAGVNQTCLIREPRAGTSVLIGCWSDLAPGRTGLTLGNKGSIDGNYRGAAGDTYALEFDGVVVERAALVGRVVLPVVRR